MTTNVDRLLTNAQAAEMLSISTRTLSKLRDSGDLPVVHVSSSRKGRRFSMLALQSFIESRQSVSANRTGLSGAI